MSIDARLTGLVDEDLAKKNAELADVTAQRDRLQQALDALMSGQTTVAQIKKAAKAASATKGNRGRPKGSKNRTPEERERIKAEKEALKGTVRRGRKPAVRPETPAPDEVVVAQTPMISPMETAPEMTDEEAQMGDAPVDMADTTPVADAVIPMADMATSEEEVATPTPTPVATPGFQSRESLFNEHSAEI